jgi:hypothetical protein
MRSPAPVGGSHRRLSTADQPDPLGRLFFAGRKAAEGDLYREERRQVGQAAAREAALIKEVRHVMAEAHPDHGGTAQQFIEARSSYQAALLHARGRRRERDP